MAGLLDIAPAVASVTIRGVTIPVQGVNAKGIAYLLGRFPALRALMSGREVDASTLMNMGGDIVAAILAAGCGFPGDAEQEAAAERLSVDEQADILAAIIPLTMPGGIGPFVEKVSKMGSLLGAEASVPAGNPPATN